MSADDFEDDGGTPQWRASHQYEAQLLGQAEGPLMNKKKQAKTWAYRDLTFLQMVGWFVVFPVVGMFFFYVFGLLLCYWGVAFGWSIFWAALPLVLIVVGRITTPNENPASQIRHYRRR